MDEMMTHLCRSKATGRWGRGRTDLPEVGNETSGTDIKNFLVDRMLVDGSKGMKLNYIKSRATC
jgi:hypothetical protein